MATAEKPFIRQDGKDKVTGLGRYTADLTMTGMLEAKFRYADHAHARITRIDTSKAKALPGVFAVITHEDVPDVRYGPFRPGPAAVRQAQGALRGRAGRGGGGAHARDRPARRRADRGRLRAARDRQRRRGRPPARGAAAARGLGRRTEPPRTSSATATTARARRSSRATPTRAWPRPTSSSRSATSRTCRTPCRSSPMPWSRSGRETGSRSGRRRRCRSSPGAAWPPRWSCPRRTSASWCRTWAAGSAASASSTTRPRWRRWPASPSARCAWCSRAARSSSPPITAARDRCSSWRPACAATAASLPAAAA